MSVRLLKRRFTVEEYERMGQAGILSEDDRVELIEGEIIEVPSISPPHAAVRSRLNELFSAVRSRAIVRIGGPVRLGNHSMPEPDVALVKPRDDYYASRHPGPDEVLLLVEVGDATLDYDREVKIPLCARARIPEVWLVALPLETVEVYRGPVPNGYRGMSKVGRGDSLSIVALPDINLSVTHVLGAPNGQT